MYQSNAALSRANSLKDQQMLALGYKPYLSNAQLPAGAVTRAEPISYSWQTTNPKSGSTNNSRSSVRNYFKEGTAPAPAAPAAPAPAAAPAAAAPVPQTVPGNAALSIPGIDVRLTGEQVGIKPAESTERKAKTTSTGSNRLTIPRSSGASGLNIG